MVVVFVDTTETFGVTDDHIYRLTIWIEAG
jgi:hypothetical protein